MPCWVILTERLWKWGWHTANYGCSLLMCLIKLLPFPFIVLGNYIRSVPPLCFSNSYMRYMVAGRLCSLLLPTLLVVCLCSISSLKVLTGPPCISWLLLIYPCYVGEPQDLIGILYFWWLCPGCPFSSKIQKGLPRYPRKKLYFMGCP